MHPYSVKDYFIRNKRRFISVTLMISLGVFFVYTLSMLISGMEDSFIRSSLTPYENLSAVYARGTTFSAARKAELEKQEFIAHVMPVVSYNMPIQLNIGGTNNAPFFVLSGEDISLAMEVLNLKLVKGRLPEAGKLEALLHADVAANLNVSVGDGIGSGLNTPVWFPEEYRVVGIIEGRPLVSFARLLINDAYKYGMLVLPEKGRLEDMNAYLEGLESRVVSVSTWKVAREALDMILDRIDLLITVLCILVIVLVSACSGFLCYIYFSQRRNEFGLIWAIGYTRQEIVRRAFIEIGAMNGFGFLAGLMMSLLAGVILNLLLYSPSGQSLMPLGIELLTRGLSVPLIASLSGMLPVWRYLTGLEPIQTLEGVD